MPFKKAKVVAKLAKISQVQTERHAKNRIEPNLNPAGRRIVDLALLSHELWCGACKDTLSLRYLQEEIQKGLASLFKVQCHRCKVIVDVHSSGTVADTSGNGRSLHAINCKAAIACIDTGVGHDQFNKLLSAMNLPVISRDTMKLAEERVGPGIVEVAEESCRAAIFEERRCTLSKRIRTMTEVPAEPDDVEAVTCEETECTTPKRPRVHPTSSPAVPTPVSPSSQHPRRPRHRALSLPPRALSPLGEDAEEVDITVKYDFGWDKRGTGFAYDSRSGRGCMIGEETNLVLAFGVKSKDCAKCDRGHELSDHKCPRNWTGSSKAMEPATAVDLALRNPDLQKAKVRVGTVVGDRDSSTLAALQRESPHPISKVLDVNHNIKGLSNTLWKMKTSGKHKFLTNDMITYFKRCFSYALEQNKGNEEEVKRAIVNIVDHTYGRHASCGQWCKAKDVANYEYKSLPGKKCLTCPVFEEDLRAALQLQADNADQLAPCGSSQNCESFNQMVNTRAPKTRHYAGSQANMYRVSAAVSYKNLGAGHLDTVFQRLYMSPSSTGSKKYRLKVQYLRERKADYKTNPDVKKRRLLAKLKGTSKESASARKEGLTYVSGMATLMETAASASAVQSWLPTNSNLQDDCRFVIVDLETTGFHATAEIVQVAATCGDMEFCQYILPKNRFSSGASEVTGLTLQNNQLCYRGAVLETSSSDIVADQFLKFLHKCGPQVVLVGHNIIRFDAPRIIKWLRENGFVKEFCALTHGLVDTLPLISQGKVKKQEILAREYLTTPEWKKFLSSAHNALSDCKVLAGLLLHFQVSDDQLKSSIKTTRAFLEEMARAKRRKENFSTLKPLQDANISVGMINRMCEHGVTIDELVKAYRGGGKTGLKACLSVQINGKPRVSSSKKVCDQVEKFVEQWISK